MTERQVVIASNRGPVSFVRDDNGEVVPKRGSGGLVTALTGALQASGGLWVASAMTNEDREQARAGRLEVETEGSAYDVRYLAFDADAYDAFYNGISNHVLWFVHHCLWDTPRRPLFDAATRRAWEQYRDVNRSFAETLAEEGRGCDPSAAYLVQDYHLSLVPAMLRDLDPEARISHFSHIPFAGPSYFSILPGAMRDELLSGLLGADVVGFHADRWAEAFLLACRDLEGTNVDLEGRTVGWQGRTVRVGIYPISIEVAALQEQARSRSTRRALRRLQATIGDTKLLLRVDRTDLSKNILRGFLAYEAFLRDRPDWRERVVFLALLNPSRTDLPEYRRYVRECLKTGERINVEFGTQSWKPVRLSFRDDFPRTLAAYTLYDALLVNPVFDGMNLVAKEGPVLNEHDGVLILSRNAGAFEELAEHALPIEPFDLEATREAIERALEMDPDERADRAEGLRKAVLANPLDEWVTRQVADLDGS